MKKYIKYTGEKLDKSDVTEHSYTVNSFEDDRARQKKAVLEERIAPYFPEPELVASVEYARLLNRPLLLRGEPGCGKTKLAQALAYELHEEQYRDYYFEWNIKSTSKAIDGLYVFDHLARLRDAQPGGKKKETHEYRRFGPLGKAFIRSSKEAQAILLIDEIDKADIDFPNDLLLELDQKRFFIEETNEEIVAERPPIIIITSNDERELPSAFLRRCVFHYINFPSDSTLFKILQSRSASIIDDFKKLGVETPNKLEDEDLRKIVSAFKALYQNLHSNPGTQKNVSTSELIDWLKIIYYKFVTGEIEKKEGVLPLDKLLYPEVLLKTLDDQRIAGAGK
ncbi:MAG: MoxR family ATPase [Cyanobacteria bacterium J06649_11]